MRILSALTLPALALLFVGLASPAAAQSRADPEAASGMVAKPDVRAEKHMIVAANPIAAEAGFAVLEEGGSAADATIAALLVLNVVEPQSSGIGGGAFAVIHAGDGPYTLDARETAPAGATPEMFIKDGEPMPWREAVATGRSIGTPSLVRLMEELHRRHGRLEWQRLFAPAIALAKDGFPVSPRLAGLLEQYGARLDGSTAGAVFRPNGTPLGEGEILRQPALAATLEQIAADGGDAFYTGAIAETIVAAVGAEPVPGSLSLADLSAYRVIERPAVCHPFGPGRVCGMGPPSSGATTVGQILMLLERSLARDTDHEESEVAHAFAEASRLAYADRAAFLGDPDFVTVPVRGLLDPGYMDDRASLIDMERASEGKAEAGDPPWREGRLRAPDLALGSPGTTHLSVIDGDGLAISLTASIETAFGSGRMAAGFLLNNQLTDFSFTPSRDGKPIANSVAPGKRPRSSMAPTIAYIGDRPAVLTGSPGGSRIPEYVARTILEVFANSVSPAKSAARSNISHRNRGEIVVEPHMGPATIEKLRAIGHVVEIKDMTSGLHTIVIGPDVMVGGADPRREGVALGK